MAEAVIDVVNTPAVLSGIKQREQLFREGWKPSTPSTTFSGSARQGPAAGAVLNDDFKGRSRRLPAASIDQGLMALVAGTNVVRVLPSPGDPGSRHQGRAGTVRESGRSGGQRLI